MSQSNINYIEATIKYNTLYKFAQYGTIKVINNGPKKIKGNKVSLAGGP
jgi:hypothetical protein